MSIAGPSRRCRHDWTASHPQLARCLLPVSVPARVRPRADRSRRAACRLRRAVFAWRPSRPGGLCVAEGAGPDAADRRRRRRAGHRAQSSGDAAYACAGAARKIVPCATHLFEEIGALELVSQLALKWCTKYLKGHQYVIREVPAREWGPFLEGFGREHRAWLATVHVVDAGGAVTRWTQVRLKSATQVVDAALFDLAEGQSRLCASPLRLTNPAGGYRSGTRLNQYPGRSVHSCRVPCHRSARAARRTGTR